MSGERAAVSQERDVASQEADPVWLDEESHTTAAEVPGESGAR